MLVLVLSPVGCGDDDEGAAGASVSISVAHDMLDDCRTNGVSVELCPAAAVDGFDDFCESLVSDGIELSEGLAGGVSALPDSAAGLGDISCSFGTPRLQINLGFLGADSTPPCGDDRECEEIDGVQVARLDDLPAFSVEQDLIVVGVGSSELSEPELADLMVDVAGVVFGVDLDADAVQGVG